MSPLGHQLTFCVHLEHDTLDAYEASSPMGEIQIRYDNGAAYERMMGTWSRAAGASQDLRRMPFPRLRSWK